MAAMNTRFPALTALVLTINYYCASVHSAEKALIKDGSYSAECQEIKIDMCQSELPYNYTAYPNLVDNENQREAEMQLHTFDSLIKVQCSSQLKFFLCSVYVPMCTPKVRISIGPCRPLCESVRRRCEPILSKFGVPWPASLNCSKFLQENSVESMCMIGPPEEKDSAITKEPVNIHNVPIFHQSPTPVYCPDKSLRTEPKKYVYVNRTGTCALKCSKTGLFNAGERNRAELVTFGMALISSLLALLSFISLRFRSHTVALKYPEFPLLFVALCSGCGCVAYLVLWFAGRSNISCVEYTGTQILVVSGLNQIRCTVVGILLYFFTISSRLWWLVLCWCCFVSAGLRWRPETLYNHQFWYHAFVWVFSVILVVISLVQKAIDADELTGMCYIGQQSRNETALLRLLVIPELLILVSGLVALLVAVGWNLRESKQNRAVAADGGLYSTVVAAGCYIPCGSALLVCYLYEYCNRQKWSEDSNHRPNVDVFLLKIVTNLSYGILAALWIILRKFCCLYSARFTQSKQPARSSVTMDYPREPMIPSSSCSQNNMKSYPKYWVDL